MDERIVIDPGVCHGKPVIRGTRTPITVVLAALAGGDSYADIQEDYGISSEDIQACIAFACKEIDRQTYLPLSA
jgi:uncharacterized protein (DUF433 family)